jgi:hypothetical protein
VTVREKHPIVTARTHRCGVKRARLASATEMTSHSLVEVCRAAACDRLSTRPRSFLDPLWKKRGSTVPEPVEGTAGGFDKLSHRFTRNAWNGLLGSVSLSGPW